MASGTSSGTFRLVARVPVSCWVRPDGPMTSETGYGSVVEACNSPGGFQVTASYRPLEQGESAKLRYGDHSVALSSAGQAPISRSNMARIRTVNYRFEEAELARPLVLVLSIQPL